MYEKLEQELTQATSVEEMQEILKNNGVEMTEAEIQAKLREFAPQGELSEDDLSAVAGGRIGVRGPTEMDVMKKLVRWIIKKFK